MRTNQEWEIILARKTGTGEEEIVLGRREDFESKPNSPGVYVTWLSPRPNEYCWGHYFGDVADTAEDFASRVKRGY